MDPTGAQNHSRVSAVSYAPVERVENVESARAVHPPAIDGLHMSEHDTTRSQLKQAPHTNETGALTLKQSPHADETRALTLNATAIDGQLAQSVPGLNTCTSPHALSRQLATLRKRLMKKEEESTAATQQGKLKDQR